VNGPSEDALRRWRLEACQAAGLPPALASRLNGATPEAIATDARILADQSRAEQPATGEAQALARLAIKNARAAQSFGPGVMGGKLSPAPVETAEKTWPEELVRDDGE